MATWCWVFGGQQRRMVLNDVKSSGFCCGQGFVTVTVSSCRGSSNIPTSDCAHNPHTTEFTNMSKYPRGNSHTGAVCQCRVHWQEQIVWTNGVEMKSEVWGLASMWQDTIFTHSDCCDLHGYFYIPAELWETARAIHVWFSWLYYTLYELFKKKRSKPLWFLIESWSAIN